ncbi:hypothetical protein THF1D04_50385 [Vibrio owensii]|uniref:Uncharacterized protein n=1 Tax=Vibrio owensii TaxID=696485 RepID=A0AAU9QC03_9VIBR|nr:hypothetical protein THF1D04_50385 [Vibrio owensii]
MDLESHFHILFIEPCYLRTREAFVKKINNAHSMGVIPL